MKQYKILNNDLTMKVKKSPIFVRVVMFLFTFLFFLAPFLGMFVALLIGNKFHIGYIIGIGLFGLLGFYMLRISLWNTYGFESINIKENGVLYEANYGWFKDGKRSLELKSLTFSFRKIGYDEDNEGVMVIGEGENELQCVTKMNIDELKEMIHQLENK